jgi:tetratricopeptide (TPR) repeat protein
MKDIFQRLEEEKDPKLKIGLLLELSKMFLNSDLGKCEAAAIELHEIGENHNLPLATMHYYLVLGRISYRRGELELANNYFKQGELLAIEINSPMGQANSLEAVGLILNKQGQHAEAIQLIHKAFEIYSDMGAHNGQMGLAYNNIANTYNYLKQTTEAKKYYRLAIDALENSERRQSIYLIRGNLGILLFHEGEYEESIVNFKAGLLGFIEQNNVQAQSQAYCHIGNGYLALGQHVKALEHFQKGLKLTRTTDFDTELSSIYHGLGNLYVSMTGYSEALNYYNKTMAIRLEKGYWLEACETYMALYSLYSQMNEPILAAQALASGKQLSAEKSVEVWQKRFLELKD